MTRGLLTSTNQMYVEKILAGTKTVELRRWKPQLEKIAHIAIHTSSPVKAVVATAKLAEFVSLPLDELCDTVGADNGDIRKNSSITSTVARLGTVWCWNLSLRWNRR